MYKKLEKRFLTKNDCHVELDRDEVRTTIQNKMNDIAKGDLKRCGDVRITVTSLLSFKTTVPPDGNRKSSGEVLKSNHTFTSARPG